MRNSAFDPAVRVALALGQLGPSGVFYQKKSPLSRKKKFRLKRASVANFFPDMAESAHL